VGRLEAADLARQCAVNARVPARTARLDEGIGIAAQLTRIIAR
jgi:hypothetical protein